MINKDLKLNKNLFKENVDTKPIRNGFGEGLLEAAEKDERIIGVCADLTESTRMHFFAEKFPERFVEVGVAEQNLVTVASGMAAMGKIPFVTSYAMFSPGRNWEQIRTTIGYNDRPVKIAGSHAGISVGPDGGTHQAIEDIALMRVLPRFTVLSPCDAEEARKSTLALAETDNPGYIRLARNATPIITTEKTPFEIGKAYEIYRSEKPKVTFAATGSLVYQALLAAKELEEDGIGSIVLNFPTIKPLDEEVLLASVKETKKIVSIEEHQIAGGFGSAIAEVLAKKRPTKQVFVGVKDQYGQSGNQEELLAHYGIDKDGIIKAVREVL